MSEVVSSEFGIMPAKITKISNAQYSKLTKEHIYVKMKWLKHVHLDEITLIEHITYQKATIQNHI